MLLYQFDAAVSRVFSWSVFKKGRGFGFQGSGFRVQGSGFRVQGSGFRVQGCGGSFAAIYMGDARRFLGKQVSHLSVSAMILLTANDKDFSLRSK